MGKSCYLIIAGPQAAGKTTAIRLIREQGKNPVFDEDMEFCFFKEGRAIINSKYSLKGAVSITRLDEIEAIELDLRRMSQLQEGIENRCYFDESNIFTLSHASMRHIPIRSYFDDYCSLLEKLNTGIIFLDITPEISWGRRKRRYIKRVENLPSREQEKMLAGYKNYISSVYNRLLNLYEMIRFPKIRIDASLPINQCLSNEFGFLREMLN